MDGEEWVSITEAASRLTEAGDPIDRSTLSRYLKQHSEALPTRRAGKAALVDLMALAAHRGENIRIRAPVVTADSGGRGRGAPLAPSRSRFAGSQSDGAARKAQADAELREMDLAQRRKQLTPTAEVDQAGRDAVALMSSAFDRMIDTAAAQASLKYGWDERTARVFLKGFARGGLDVFHREILDRLDAMRRDADAAELEGQSAMPAPAQGGGLQ
jgi:hypothetical protein